MRNPISSHLLRAGVFAAVLLPPTRIAPPTRAAAMAVLDTAIARMGGADALSAITRVRFEMLTQWQRTAFDTRPYADQPSYELHTEVRDYSIDAWRNTRRFGFGAQARDIVDVVRDSVAVRRSLGGSGGVASPTVVTAGTWTPLNIAYVQEKNELFAVAPERLLLRARSATDLRALPDTTIGSAPHARVFATVDGLPVTIFMRRSTGYLTAVRFRINEENDFGLVPWGTMEVEFWYSAWRKYPNGIAYPSQFDVRRVGKPYKRMTVMSAAWNPPAMPDSFPVTDSLRAAYMSTSRRPMHDVPFDSARVIDERFAMFNAPGAPMGAVKIGTAWLLLEAGQAPLSAERASAWLSSVKGGGLPTHAFVTVPASGNGGVAWLVSHGVDVHVAPGAVPFMEAVLQGHDVKKNTLRKEESGRWIRIGGDSVRVEPIDLADAPGAMVVYAPSLKWVYSALAANPLHLDRIRALVQSRGWKVSRLGTARNISVAY